MSFSVQQRFHLREMYVEIKRAKNRTEGVPLMTENR